MAGSQDINFPTRTKLLPTLGSQSMDRKVKFPHELVFKDMVKDGDSAEMVSFLKRPSVDPQSIINTQGNQDQPALHQLVKEGNLKCIRILANLGADVNMADDFGKTPLHLSVIAGNLTVTKFLLRNGANPDIGDNDGNTPVDFTDDFDLIEMLLTYSPEEKRRKSLK